MSYIVKEQVCYAITPNLTPNDEKGYGLFKYIVYIYKTKIFRNELAFYQITSICQCHHVNCVLHMRSFCRKPFLIPPQYEFIPSCPSLSPFPPPIHWLSSSLYLMLYYTNIICLLSALLD